ncbi:MAG: hypothetical protein ACQESL_00610 [Bacteroidota bacterium]
MKAKKLVPVLVGVIIAFAVGLMVGITLTNPGMSLREAAGTIGRIDQYRNVQITEEDIELRNELLEDSQMREAYEQYLAFEYANNVKLGEDIRHAINAAHNSGEFPTSNRTTLDKLEDYAMFLDNARLRILEAIGTLDQIDERDKIAIRSILSDAGNALAQTVFRSNVLFDYMNGVEVFFDTASKADYPDLANAHDRLFANLIQINMVNENRPVLEHLLAKELMDEEGELAQLDAQTLEDLIIMDAEQLGVWDAEQLQDILFDNEVLLSNPGGFLDMQQLNMTIMDAENLGDMPLFDTEQLGYILDSEQLQGTLDAEQLGAFSNTADQLQLVIPLN